jgi:hypothetical protein
MHPRDGAWADSSKVRFGISSEDYEKLKDAKDTVKRLPSEVSKLPRPIIGFVGAIDPYKFDMNLFKKVVSDFPTYSFVLIGAFALKTSQSSRGRASQDGQRR